MNIVHDGHSQAECSAVVTASTDALFVNAAEQVTQILGGARPSELCYCSSTTLEGEQSWRCLNQSKEAINRFGRGLALPG